MESVLSVLTWVSEIQLSKHSSLLSHLSSSEIDLHWVLTLCQSLGGSFIYMAWFHHHNSVKQKF